MLTLAGYAVATALMALFSLVSVVGIRWFTHLNNVLVWWKIIVIVLYEHESGLHREFQPFPIRPWDGLLIDEKLDQALKHPCHAVWAPA